MGYLGVIKYGKFWNKLIVYSFSVVSINVPKRIREAKTAKILGTNASVGSWIDVTVWNILTTTPTTSPIKSGGAETKITVYIASWINVIIMSCVNAIPP